MDFIETVAPFFASSACLMNSTSGVTALFGLRGFTHFHNRFSSSIFASSYLLLKQMSVINVNPHFLTKGLQAHSTTFNNKIGSSKASTTTPESAISIASSVTQILTRMLSRWLIFLRDHLDWAGILLNLISPKDSASLRTLLSSFTSGRPVLLFTKCDALLVDSGQNRDDFLQTLFTASLDISNFLLLHFTPFHTPSHQHTFFHF